MQTTRLQTFAVLAVALLAAAGEAQTAISADGAIESKSGGFKFPDGSVQTTAAVVANPCLTLDPSDEMIQVGGVCIDKYEASIWDAPVGGSQITGFVPCREDGQNCDNIWARSVAGVEPREEISWFQAQAALANSGKRLITNSEWQMAAAGTPDSLACNVSIAPAMNTGAKPDCVSDWGAFDMVGNLSEFVADWVPASTDCPGWGGFSDDEMCLSGASTTLEAPGALIRGGNFQSSSAAGPFAVRGFFEPSFPRAAIGFRGAR